LKTSNVEFLAHEDTAIGTLMLRRRELLSKPGTVVTEITLDHEFLMSSYSNASERALSQVAREMHGGRELNVLVGGLGLLLFLAFVAATYEPVALAVARAGVGALFLGAIGNSMLLGHWYLLQPGMSRAPLLELVWMILVLWPIELLLQLWPTGMLSVISGDINDGSGGLLGWFWIGCVVLTPLLVIATRLALREKQYEAVMAATGLLYLAILTGFGMDLIARALLGSA
jgi:hypothetical protein